MASTPRYGLGGYGRGLRMEVSNATGPVNDGRAENLGFGPSTGNMGLGMAMASNPIETPEWYKQRASVMCFRDQGEKEVLLVTRKTKYRKWTLPGGRIKDNESVEEAAKRELKEEANVEARIVQKLGVFPDSTKMENTTVFIAYLTNEIQQDYFQPIGRQRRWFDTEEASCKVKKRDRHCFTRAFDFKM